MKTRIAIAAAALLASQAGQAALVTDPSDPRVWQGATVSTFAGLFGLTNQQVIDKQLLDDGLFSPTGYVAATLVANANGGGCVGRSFDSTGTGSFGYDCGAPSLAAAANAIDNYWFQTDGAVGQTVFDLGLQATKAAVFNSIDHGPLPQEAIESTVYLSNDKVTWTQAVVERVWLEGWQPILGIKWDGFVYGVGTGTSATFRYASVIHGGPGALIDDGDDEINGILGTGADFKPPIPEPGTWAMMALGLAGLGFARRRAMR